MVMEVSIFQCAADLGSSDSFPLQYAGGELFNYINYIVESGELPEAEARRFSQQMLYVLLTLQSSFDNYNEMCPVADHWA